MTYKRLAFNKSLTRSFLHTRRRRSYRRVHPVAICLFIAPVFMLYVSLVFLLFVLGFVAELVYNTCMVVRH